MMSNPALERALCQNELRPATTRALGLGRVSVEKEIKRKGNNKGNQADGDANKRARVMQDFMSMRFNKSSHRRPRRCLSVTAARRRATTSLAGIRAGGCNLHRLPKRLFRTLSGRDGSGICKIRPLTVAGAAQVRLAGISFTLLLPVELRRVNHAASTNIQILTTDSSNATRSGWP